MKHVFALALHVNTLLDGGSGAAGSDHSGFMMGLTTEEERAACRIPQASCSPG